MPLKFLSARGSGSTADAISALDYAVMMGARITNNSWGGGAFSQALFDSISAAQTAGHLFVAETDDNDALTSFSNFGLLTVDLGAPGALF